MEKEFVLEVIKEEVVCGKEFKMYGSIEQPMFKADDVAKWIDHSATHMMIKPIDEDEKSLETIFREDGSTNKQWFVTEDGLYEVLMLSRKPIAKEFKKEVKKILKQMRLTGASFVKGREEDAIKTYFPMFSEDTKLAMVQELIDKNDKIQLELDATKSIVNQQSGTVAFVKMISDKGNTISMKKFADSLGIIGLGRNILYELLRELKFVLPDSTEPYRKWIESGYLVAKASVSKNGQLTYSTRVTPKGQEYLTKKILKELDKNFIHISNEAKDYAKQLIDIIGKSEEEYFAMLIRPESFRDEWEGVMRFIRETSDEDFYLADEIEEMLSEVE